MHLSSDHYYSVLSAPSASILLASQWHWRLAGPVVAVLSLVPIASWHFLILLSRLILSLPFWPKLHPTFHSLSSGLLPERRSRRLLRHPTPKSTSWATVPRLGLRPHFSQTANPFQTFSSLPLLPLYPSYSPSQRRTSGTSVHPLRIKLTARYGHTQEGTCPGSSKFQWINRTTHQGCSALIGGYLSLQSSVQLQFSPKRSLPAPVTHIHAHFHFHPTLPFVSLHLSCSSHSWFGITNSHTSNSPWTTYLEPIGSKLAGLLGPTDLVDLSSLGHTCSLP